MRVEECVGIRLVNMNLKRTFSKRKLSFLTKLAAAPGFPNSIHASTFYLLRPGIS